jgi:hypothetical protein
MDQSLIRRIYERGRWGRKYNDGRYFTGPGGAGATVSDATAQMAIVAAVIIANASA